LWCACGVEAMQLQGTIIPVDRGRPGVQQIAEPGEADKAR
jgi:hypothetical protein